MRETKVADENGNPVEKSSVGELAVKGYGVMKRCYKNPKATEKVMRDGRIFTGDMAREEEDSFICLVDRKKDVIIRGGGIVEVRIKN